MFLFFGVVNLKVYIVGDCGPEHNSIRNIHKNYSSALKEWNILRIELLNNAKRYSKRDKKEEMWHRMVKNLKCKDPKKIDNYPNETPYINEYTLIE